MQVTTLTTTNVYRVSAWAAVAGGIFGILRIVSLIAYLILRESDVDTSILMNRMHDLAIAFQFVLFIPVAITLQKLSQRQASPVSYASLKTGIIACCLVALLSLLILSGIVSDIFYMLPQGAFGIWLIYFCSKLKGVLSKGLCRLGMVVGIGLILVGVFFVGYVTLVSPIPLRIPAASLEEASKIPITTANLYLHYFLDVGSLLGVLLMPIWTILIGLALFQKKLQYE